MIGAWGLLVLVLQSSAFAGSRAEAAILAGHLEEALPAAREEALAPGAGLAAKERYVDVLLNLGLQEVAEVYARDQVGKAPESADAHYLLGRAVQEPSLAMVEYLEAVRIDPLSARGYLGLGALHRAAGRLERAEAAYRTALQLDAKLREGWSGLGATLLLAGRREEALKVAHYAVEAVPENGDAYLTLATLAPEEAEAALKQAMERTRDDPRPAIALAELLLARGDGAGALAAAEASLRVDAAQPSAEQARLYAGCMKAGKLDRDGYVAARTLLAEAEGPAAWDPLVEKSGSCAAIRLGRARARAVAGERDGALDDLEVAYSLAPKDVEVNASYGLLLLALDQPNRARALLDMASNARPNDASLLMAAALAASDSGDRSGARKRMALAFRDHPLDARVALTYARVLSDAGDREGAYQVLRTAVQRIPDARLVVALVAAARDTGRNDEAADLLDALAKHTGQTSLSETAAKIRAEKKAP